MTTDQASWDEFEAMSPAQRVKARKQGRLNDLMAAGPQRSTVTEPTEWPEGQLRREDLAQMSAAAIVAAHRAGQLDHLKAAGL